MSDIPRFKVDDHDEDINDPLEAEMSNPENLKIMVQAAENIAHEVAALHDDLLHDGRHSVIAASMAVSALFNAMGLIGAKLAIEILTKVNRDNLDDEARLKIKIGIVEHLGEAYAKYVTERLGTPMTFAPFKTINIKDMPPPTPPEANDDWSLGG